MLMADLLTHPTRSIVTQSYASRERLYQNPTNGDGFGVGWYIDPKDSDNRPHQEIDPAVPCVFASITPAWSNINLKRLATKVYSPLIFAHVRAASPGLMVSEANCHPFIRGRFLWMHNGNIANFEKIARMARESLRDDLFNAVQGTTDSEMAFALFLNQIEDLMGDYSPEELQRKVIRTIRKIEDLKRKVPGGYSEKDPSYLNFAMTDGRTVIATRYVDVEGIEPATLYFSSGTRFECDKQGAYHMKREAVQDQAVIISSEPLTDNPKDWVVVPRNHLIMIRPDLTVQLIAIPAFSHSTCAVSQSNDNDIVESKKRTRDEDTSSSSSSNTNHSASAIACDHRKSVAMSASGSPSSVKFIRPNNSGQQELSQLDLREHQVTHVLSGHEGAVLCLERSYNSDLLFSGSLDGTIKIWDLQKLKCVRTLVGHAGSVLALVYSSANNYLFSASSDSTVMVWNVKTGECKATLSDAVSCVFAVAFHTDRFLFSARQDTSIKSIDISPFGGLDNKRVLRGHTGYVYTLLLYRDVLISASGDGTIRVWDTNEMKEVRNLSGHGGAVYALARFEAVLYSASKDTTIKVWDLDTWHCVRTLSGHASEVTALSVSAHYLYSTSADGAMKIWDRERLLCVQTVAVSPQQRPLALCATESALISAHASADIRIWDRFSGHGDLLQGNSLTERLKSLNGFSMTEALSAFVSIRTVSSDPAMSTECYKGAKFLLALLESLGLETRLLPVKPEGRNPIVYARLGSDPALPTVMFYGHYDVVPANETGWLTDPWTVTGKDGFLYGRGTTDNKGPMLATIFGVKELLLETRGKALPFNALFVYEGEEESHSEGFAQVVLEQKLLFSPVNVVVITNSAWLGDAVPCLIYGLRGVIDLEIEVSGPARDLHGGTEGGVVFEPFHELTAILSAVVDSHGRVLIPGFYSEVRPLNTDEERLYDDLELDVAQYKDAVGVAELKGSGARELLMQRWREPNLSITSIDSSGAGGRVISKRVTARISVRYVPNQAAEKLTALIESFVQQRFLQFRSPNRVRTRVLHQGEWWLSDPKNAYFGAAARAIQNEWGRKPLFVREGGTIPITAFLEKELRAPVVHLPLSQASDRPHLENERIKVEVLTKAKGVIKNFLFEVGTLSSARSLTSVTSS